MPSARRNSIHTRRARGPLPKIVKLALDDEGQGFFLKALLQPRFGELMQEWRELRKLTYRQVAKESGISPSTWCRAEAGEDLRLSKVARILAWAINHRMIEQTAEAGMGMGGIAPAGS